MTGTLFLLVALLPPTQAGSAGTEAWQAMKRRVAYDRIRARFLRDEEASILQGLREIEEGLRLRRQEVTRLEQRLEGLDKKLERLAARRQESEAALNGLRDRAGRRLAAMHRLRRTSVAQLVARIADPIRARRLRDRFGFVLAHDKAMLGAARRVDGELQRTAATILAERTARARTKELLEREIEAKALLEAERRALSEAIRSERQSAERLVRELSAAAQRLEEEMGRIRGQFPAPEPRTGGFRAQRGRLPWPVAGQVEVTFGKRVDPGSDVVLVSNGIDIRAPQNAPVRAVFAGRVVFAGRFEGFGRMLVMEHDGGFYSLYAHLESFGASVGSLLAQHQVLGFVGDTGSIKGPYLYLEIREGRKPVDPMRWLVDEGRLN